jgi:uncharacterized protein YcfL
MKNFVIATAIAGGLFLSACSSTPPGPVQPEVGSKAPGVLVIDPSLQPYLDVPNGEQNYSYNPMNFLEYNTIVRNKGSLAMTLSYKAFFQDDAGRLVEEQDPVRFFIDPNSEKPLQVAANNRAAKKMRLNISPAK